MVRIVRFLASLLALAVVAAVPMLMRAVAAGPLTATPADEWWAALQRGELRPELVIAALVGVLLLAWLRVVLGLLVEAAAALRRRPARRVRGLGSGQRLAAVIIGGLTAVVSLVPRVPGEAMGRAMAAAPHTVVVQPGDTLSRIAASHLGDAGAWHDIWELNRDREMGGRRFADPNLIHPGWELVLPIPAPDEVPPPVVTPEAATVAAPAAAPPAPGPVDPAPPGVPVSVAPTQPSGAAEPCEPVAAPAALPAGRDFPVPLGAALLAAAGAVGLIDARRRQRLRRAAVGARLPSPPPAVATTELALRAARPAERVARMDLALRAAAAALHGGASTHGAPHVTAVVLGGNDRLEIVLSGPAPASPPFLHGASADRWVLAPEVDLLELAPLARTASPPCPVLVQVGTWRGADVFVDVEAWGSLGVDAEPDRALVVLGALADGLALSPLAADVEILTVGLDPAGGLTDGRLEPVADTDAALERAVTTTSGLRASLTAGMRSFGARARACGERFEPSVLVLGDGSRPDIPPGQGIAALVIGRPATGCWLTEREGSWWLEPLDLPLVPVGAALDEIRALRAVLEDTGELSRNGHETSPEHRIHLIDQCAPPRPLVEFPRWELLVRLYGPPAVESGRGVPVEFERSKALELVVWLSQHRSHATRSAARTALWELDVRAATFANVVSDARRAMARCVGPPEGEEWIGRTLTEELPLHDLVATDAELIAARLERAAAADGHQAAIKELTPAVELVRGAPLEGTAYMWADAEGVSSNLVMLAVSACAELARHHLELGNVDGVLEATRIGFQVLPGHDELLALRLRAHARAGDRAALKAEWAAYERALAADPWAENPPEHLVTLRQELLRVAT